jgi:hypothetical protein
LENRFRGAAATATINLLPWNGQLQCFPCVLGAQVDRVAETLVAKKSL